MLKNLYSLTTQKNAISTALMFLSLLPTMAIAHSGLEASGSMLSSFISGLLHPLTGADHFVLAIGMGMLFSKVYSFKKGFLILVGSLTLGFLLSVTIALNSVIIESGILLSIILLTMALVSRYFNNTCEIGINKSKVLLNIHSIVLGAFAVFTACHGAAHGLDMPANSVAPMVFMGMMTAMLGLYTLGKVIAMLLTSYAKDSFLMQRLLSVIGLCAVLFI